MTHTFRKASYSDIPSIQHIANIAFRHTYKEILSPEQMDYMMEWMYSEKSILSQMDNGHEYHIASFQGRDIAYVSFRIDNPNDNGQILFHLEKIYVLPDFQGKGLGKLLLEYAEDKMKQYAHPKTCSYELNVNRGNKAIGFYQKHGLKIVRSGDFEIGKGFYMNDYIMKKTL